MLQDILQLNIFAFLLIFARIGTAFMLLPGFANQQFPARLRLGLSLAVTFVVTPMLIPKMPPMPGAPMALFELIASEAMAGAILGTVPMILLSSVEIAGSVISLSAGFASALTYDPVVQEQSGIASGFLATTAMALLFVTNLHHVFIQALLDSYSIFQPGVAPDPGDALQLIARHVADTFRVGVQMSTPFLLTGFAYSLGLGILTRLAPQVPLFFIAQPLQLIVAIVVFMLSISGIMLALLAQFDEGMRPFILR